MKKTSGPDPDECTGMTVNAGDSVRDYTYYYDSTNKYSTGVFNYDEFDICSTSYTNEYEDAHYAQFITERPEFTSGLTNLPSFSDFDMEAEIMINGVYEGLGDYDTLGHTWKHNMKNSGTTNIETSFPDVNDDIHFDYRSSSGT